MSAVQALLAEGAEAVMIVEAEADPVVAAAAVVAVAVVVEVDAVVAEKVAVEKRMKVHVSKSELSKSTVLRRL